MIATYYTFYGQCFSTHVHDDTLVRIHRATPYLRINYGMWHQVLGDESCALVSIVCWSQSNETEHHMPANTYLYTWLYMYACVYVSVCTFLHLPEANKYGFLKLFKAYLHKQLYGLRIVQLQSILMILVFLRVL